LASPIINLKNNSYSLRNETPIWHKADNLVKENMFKSTLTVFEAKISKMNEGNVSLLVDLDKKMQILHDMISNVARTGTQVSRSSNKKKDRLVRFETESRDSKLNNKQNDQNDYVTDKNGEKMCKNPAQSKMSFHCSHHYSKY
jgi:hypothetical protein